MGRHTGNRDVVTKLQKALEDFLADQRTAAEKDPEWKRLPPERQKRKSKRKLDVDAKIVGLLANYLAISIRSVYCPSLRGLPPPCVLRLAANLRK